MIHITVTDKTENRDGFSMYTEKSHDKPTCLECSSSGLLHTCGHCSACCLCIPCSVCQQVQPDPYCGLCNACPTCCTCALCTTCRRIVSGALCAQCNACQSCCTGRGTAHGGILFIRNQVDLDKYVPDEKARRYNPSPRLLSAEIETCGYNSKAVGELNRIISKWNSSVVRDGSLPEGGFEINTHPAGGDYWMTQCTELYAAMTTAKVKFNQAAGCHIHVDARDLGYIQIANMLRLYYYTETAFYRLIARERRTNHFCAMCATGYFVAIERVKAALKKANDDTQRAIIYRQAILNELYKTKAVLTKPVPKSFVLGIKRDKGNGPRYRGLNLHSWIHRGTVEFRFPGHQPSAHDLQMMGCMLANFLDLAKRSEDDVSELVAPVADAWKEQVDIAKIAESSLDFLVSLSPSRAVSDWIRERAKVYNAMTTTFTTQL